MAVFSARSTASAFAFFGASQLGNLRRKLQTRDYRTAIIVIFLNSGDSPLDAWVELRLSTSKASLAPTH